MNSFGKNSLLSYKLSSSNKMEIKLKKIFTKCFSEISSTELVDSLESENHDIKMILSSSNKNMVDVYGQHLGHFAVAVDGKFINHETLINTMLKNNQIVRRMSSEEVLVNLFLKESENESSWPKLIKQILNNYPGGYSFIVLTKNRIYAARDCYGIRPLVLGCLCDAMSVVEYDVEDGKPVVKPKTPNVIASDSVLLNKINAKYIRQVVPGEIIELCGSGIKSLGVCFRKSGDSSTLCSMEYILLSKPSTLLEEQRVQNIQFKLGEALANSCSTQTECITTLPNLSLAFLLGFTHVCNIQIVEAFYYVFTITDDAELNIYNENVVNKSVTLIVDSPMNSCLKLAIILLKKSGTKEVHLRICSPLTVDNCPFGIEIDHHDDILNDVSSVQYLRMEDLTSIVSTGIEGKEARNVDHCFHCFGGRHSMLKNL